MKTCACCGLSKPLDDFCVDNRRADGRLCYCRGCSKIKRQKIPRAKQREYQNRWRAQNAEHVRAKERERYAADPQKAKEIQQRYRKKNAAVISLRRRGITLAAYGLTQDQYDSMLAEQGGVCAICRSDDPQHWSNRFQVDHDHETNEVRGLLCAPCNGGLGLFRDDPKRLVAALGYVLGKPDITAKITAACTDCDAG